MNDKIFPFEEDDFDFEKEEYSETTLIESCKSLLLEYVLMYNTKENRDDIKNGISELCQMYKNHNIIYEYKVVCDETNNTPDVIDNRMGVVDIYTKEKKSHKTKVTTITLVPSN